MKKFIYKLDAVERHRKMEEQEKQIELSRSLEKMRKTEQRLLALDMLEVKARREFSKLGSPANQDEINSSDFWLLDQFIQGQKVRRVDVKRQLEMDEQEVGNVYRDFIEARKKRKIMEKLKERRHQQFLNEKKKIEGRELDELYVTRSQLKILGELEGSEDE
ncbi:MAG: flagellar export protein FliJ [Oligoflexia bacterium]|nr:flagellar export protein FliJ [Oligoflexia bacterium]